MKTRSASTRSRSQSGTRAAARRSTTLKVSRPGARTTARKSTRAAKPKTAQISRSAKVTVDHDEIQRWAQARKGMPSVVKRTHRPSEPEGLLRIDFPGFSGAGTLDHISWEEWFEIFDKHKLAFIYQERKVNGEPSTFCKLVRCTELC